MVATETGLAPGVYPDVTADEYHADPVPGGSLSSSGARKLLPPSCPALYRWELDNGEAPKRHFDIGSAAHQIVLGSGPEIVVVDAENYRTNAAKAARDDARAAGRVPLLPDEHAQVTAMAAALRRHPVAAALLDPAGGRAEQTLIWRDAATGVMRRARLDWLPAPRGQGRVIIPDYKTCVSAEPDELARAVHRHGYHQQGDWYLAGAQALDLAGDDAVFVFICQEKTPPYIVTVVELDATAMRIGKSRNRRALAIYRHCTESGQWPGYTDDIALLSLPPWAEIQEGEPQ